MNAYLVMARCGFDDLPMLLTEDLAEAQEFASVQTVDSVCEFSTNTECLPEVYVVHGVDVYQFVGGKLVSVDNVIGFE